MPAPAGDEMRIGEGEGLVLRDGEPLAEWRQSRLHGRNRQGLRQGLKSRHVDMGGDAFDGTAEEAFEVFMLARLDEAQMPARQGQCGIARDGAQDGDVRSGQGLAQGVFMARAGDAVEDDGRHIEARPVRPEAPDQGGDRLRLMAAVDDEHDRQPQILGEIGGRAAALFRSIEKPHDAFDEGERRPVADLGGEPANDGRGHRPAVEIEARPSARRLMEARIDIVGADLRRCDGDALAGEGTQQGQRDDGLAAARGRCGDDKPVSQSDSPATRPDTSRGSSAIRRWGRGPRSPASQARGAPGNP